MTDNQLSFPAFSLKPALSPSLQNLLYQSSVSQINFYFFSEKYTWDLAHRLKRSSLLLRVVSPLIPSYKRSLIQHIKNCIVTYKASNHDS